MASPQVTPKNLAAWLHEQLSKGDNVIFPDHNHISPTLPSIIGTKDMLGQIRASGGTLILEGPKIMNSIIEGLNNGSIVPAIMRAESSVSNATGSQQLRETAAAHTDMLVTATRLGTHVHYPEQGTAYDALAKNPKAAEILNLLYNSVTSGECSDTQTPVIMGALPPRLQAGRYTLNVALSDRDTSEENGKIAQVINAQPGPHVIIYGAAHVRTLLNDIKATTITVLDSPAARYKGKIAELPNFIYFADSDTVMAIPPGSPEREAFISMHTGDGTKTGELGIPLTDEQKAACIAALPATMRQSLSTSDTEPHAPPPAGGTRNKLHRR